MRINKKTLVLDIVYYGLYLSAFIGFSNLIISTGAIKIALSGKNIILSINDGLVMMIVSLLVLCIGCIIARLKEVNNV